MKTVTYTCEKVQNNEQTFTKLPCLQHLRVILNNREIQRIISDNVILWIGQCTSNKTLLY